MNVVEEGPVFQMTSFQHSVIQTETVGLGSDVKIISVFPMEINLSDVQIRIHVPLDNAADKELVSETRHPVVRGGLVQEDRFVEMVDVKLVKVFGVILSMAPFVSEVTDVGIHNVYAVTWQNVIVRDRVNGDTSVVWETVSDK